MFPLNDNLLSFINNLPIGIFKADFHGTLIYINDYLYKLFGCDNKDSDIQFIYDLILPKDILERVVESEKTEQQYTFKVELRKNHTIWIKNKLRVSTGQEKFIEGSIEDVTEDQILFEKLQISENKYNNLFQTMAQGVVYQNQKGEIISANPAAERILGLSLEQLMGKESIDPDWKTIHEDGSDFPGENHPAMYTLKTGKPIIGVIIGVFNPQKKEIVWISVSSVPLAFDKNNKPTLVYATFEDITDRRNALMALKKSDNRYRTFTNSTVDLIFLKDDKYRYQMINKAYEKFLGLTENEVIGKTDFELMSPEIAANCYKSDQQVLLTQKSIFLKEIIEGKIYDVQKFPVLLKSDTYGVGGVLKDITELQNAQLELKKSEQKYRVLVENQSDLLVKVDVKGRFLFASPSYCRLFGKTEEELLGNKFLPLVHPDDQLSTQKEMEKLFTHPHMCYIEQRALTVNGWRWLGWADKALLNENEEVIEITGVGRDITTQKISEIVLKESEEKFRQITENIKEAIWLRDLSTDRIIYVNISFEKIWGVKREKLYLDKMAFINSIHPKDKHIFEKMLKETIDEPDKPTKIEYRIILPDSQIKWILTRTYPIFDDEGKIVRRLAVSEEITSLKQSQDQLERFFEISIDLHCILDMNGKIILINDSWESTLGYKKEELIGENVLNFIHPDDIQQTIDAINTLSNNNKIKSFINRYICKDGSVKVFEWNSTPSGEFIFGVARDISAYKEYERILKIAKEKAEKASKLKSEFLAQMSHEIRSPLNTVLNCSALLKEMLPNNSDNDIKDLFPIINSAGNRIIRTIDSILNMSELNLGTYEPNYRNVNIETEVLSIIGSELKVLATNKGLSFITEYNCSNPIVLADYYSMTQIFVNLIDNAIKYTKEGSVTIKSYNTPDNNLIVDIQDTGIGISEEFIDNLFTAFSQEEQGYSRQFEGNGLGLALVTEYCTINKAKITVQSQKGVGSIFSVHINK